MTDAEEKALQVLEKMAKLTGEFHMKEFKFKSKKEYSAALCEMREIIGRHFITIRLVGYPDEKKIEIFY